MQINEELLEFLKCKQNPLYFITNYCYAPITGGKVLMSYDNLLPKHRAFIKSCYRLHNVIFFASRRSYKSTLTAAYILWCLLFYPNYRAVIINYKKDTAKENINMIKFMYDNLPDFLKIPKKWKAERIEYFELKNGSKVEIKVPSSALPPDQLGRGFNYSLVYIDEAAFLPLKEIFGSIQPAYESARRQAQKTGYPYGMILSSTPNGVQGIGEEFYKKYMNATPIEELYDFDKEDWLSNDVEKLFKEILEKNPYRNNFVRIKLHWSEFPDRDEKWAEEIKREIEYYTSPEGKRRWNQEYDLLFLGSENSLFDDDVISKFEARSPRLILDLKYNAKLKIFNKITQDDYYIIGIDTAKSTSGDYSAIEIFNKDFIQVAELKHRFGKVKRFVEVIIDIIEKIFLEHEIYNFKLFIENNSYGNQVVEELEYYDKYNILMHMYYQKKKSKNEIEYGITTTSKTKDLMVNALYELIVEDPKRIYSQDLISELQLVEVKNNKIGAPKGYHDDLFMASCFAAFGYRELIRNGELSQFIFNSNNNSNKKNNKKNVDIVDRLIRNIAVYKPFESNEDSLIYGSRKEMDLFDMYKDKIDFDYNKKDGNDFVVFV